MEQHNRRSYEGIVEDGVVHLPPRSRLPDGTRVVVSVPPAGKAKSRSRATRPTARTAGSRRKAVCSPALLALGGKAKGLPADLATNLDHYLYGAAKRKK